MAQIGDQYGEYILDRLLGRGHFGEVWEAHRRGALVPVPVAVKLLVNSPRSRAEFLQEAQLWLQAAGSAYVVPVQDVGEHQNTFYFVSQFLSDGTLRDRIGLETGQGVPAPQALRWMEGILEGLTYLHERNIMHLDLKPENILLQGEVPRLADFGISRVLASSYQGGGCRNDAVYAPGSL
ncbi:MAG: hypothetical protein FJX77_09370 [Armatimonadetes bacterium]|nr:hypothetical protein [Armatimonadota bacterium]